MNNTTTRAHRRKISLAPLEDTKPEAETDKLTSDASLDDYIEADFNEKKIEFFDVEKDSLARTILELRQERDTLLSENSKLKEEVETLRGSNTPTINPQPNCVDGNELSKKIEELDFKNDELILKNSELEFELTRLREINSSLEAKIAVSVIDVPKTTPVPHTIGSYAPKRQMTNNGYRDWR